MVVKLRWRWICSIDITEDEKIITILSKDKPSRGWKRNDVIFVKKKKFNLVILRRTRNFLNLNDYRRRARHGGPVLERIVNEIIGLPYHFILMFAHFRYPSPQSHSVSSTNRPPRSRSMINRYKYNKGLQKWFVFRILPRGSYFLLKLEKEEEKESGCCHEGQKNSRLSDYKRLIYGDCPTCVYNLVILERILDG